MKRLITTLLVSTTAIVSLSMADGADLYKNCFGCHGEQGEKKALNKPAIIGGQEVEESLKQLIAYKNGELNQYGLGNIMQVQLSSLDEEELKELAEYIFTLKGKEK